MKRYKVTGPTAFNGHESGTEFSDVLPKDQEARAIARGSIEVVEGKKAPSAKQAKQSDATATEAKQGGGGSKPPKTGLFAGRDKEKDGGS